MTIVLVGVDHDDLYGYERINALLNHYKPEKVGVEEDMDTFNQTIEHRASLRRDDEMKDIRDSVLEHVPTANPKTVNQLLHSYGFKAQAIYDYAQRKNQQVICYGADHFWDDDFKSRLANRFLVEPNVSLITRSAKQFQEAVDEGYQDGSVPSPVVDQLHYQRRDERYAKLLREDNPENGVLLAVFGFNHVFGDYQGVLANRLDDVVTFRLCDAERI